MIGGAEGGVTVALPRALLALFPDAPPTSHVQAETVGEALDALDARWPGLRDRLIDTRPAIRRHVNVFVDGERATLGTPLAPGSEVHVFTAMSGG